MPLEHRSLDLDFSISMQEDFIPIDLLELNELVLCYALQGQLPSQEQPSSPFLCSS